MLKLIALTALLVAPQVNTGSDRKLLSVGSAPAFGAQVYNVNESPGTYPTTLGNLTAPVSAGQRIVIQIIEDDVTGTLSGVTDSKGNTYNRDAFYGSRCTNGNIQVWTYSAFVTTALSTSDDHLTLNWSTPPANSRVWSVSVSYLTGTASSGQPDSTATCGSVNSFPPRINTTGNTVAPKTVAIGGAWFNNAAWNISHGTIYSSTAGNVYYIFFYDDLTSAGPYTPGGTTAAAQTSAWWVAYK